MEKKDNTGVLFKNDKKETGNHPDYKGNITVSGVDYWLSAWIKDGKSGKFMSLALSPRDADYKSKSEKASKSMVDMDDDSVPF